MCKVNPWKGLMMCSHRSHCSIRDGRHAQLYHGLGINFHVITFWLDRLCWWRSTYAQCRRSSGGLMENESHYDEVGSQQSHMGTQHQESSRGRDTRGVGVLARTLREIVWKKTDHHLIKFLKGKCKLKGQQEADNRRGDGGSSLMAIIPTQQ